MTAYLDNAASTLPAPEVLDAMSRAAQELYANPSSAHGPGAAAARALEQARAEVASLLGAEPSEMVFTSGGTEANALGVLGAARPARGRHVVVSAIEHPAVLRSAEVLRAGGWTLTAVPPGPDGTVSVDGVAGAVRADTAVVAVMLVNNELGTVQPVAAIARALRAANLRPHFHVDAVQTAGLMAAYARDLGADSIALSAHKLHGPKGAGALWVRPGARIEPLWGGGRQEHGLRSGTENLPAWVGMGRAAALCREDAAAGARVAALRDRLEALVLKAVPAAHRTTEDAPRAPHIASITVADLPAEPMLHALEARGVYVSAGAACASRRSGPSHVLKALRVRERDAVIRFSLSRRTTAAEIELAASAFREAFADLQPVTTARFA